MQSGLFIDLQYQIKTSQQKIRFEKCCSHVIVVGIIFATSSISLIDIDRDESLHSKREMGESPH